MDLLKIMNVGFAHKSDKNQNIIIGGLDDSINLNELDIIGKEILIKNSKSEFLLEVLKISVSTSIIDKINLGIEVKESRYFDSIQQGDEVFKILC